MLVESYFGLPSVEPSKEEVFVSPRGKSSLNSGAGPMRDAGQCLQGDRCGVEDAAVPGGAVVQVVQHRAVGAVSQPALPWKDAAPTEPSNQAPSAIPQENCGCWPGSPQRHRYTPRALLPKVLTRNEGLLPECEGI